MANSPEMKSYEDLKTNESIKSDENLQKLIGEIDQIKDASNKNDDKIEWIFAETAEWKEVKKVLDQNLSNSLDKQNIWTIQILIKEVSNISKNPSLEEPVKSSVNDLLSLLLQTLDQKVQKEWKEQLEWEINQSFDKFKKMVEGKNDDGTNTLNKLNGLSKKEMENVLNFVKNKNNQSSVYSVYYMMKNVNIPTNFKRTDKDNFYTILNTIEATYPELKRLWTETVKNFQLNELFPENLTADDLKVLLETHYSKDGFVWNGSNIWNDFSFKNKNNGENISNSDFIAKFNEYNLKRIDSITQKWNDIIANLDVTWLTYDENSKNFMRNWNIIGEKGLFKELSGVDESNKYEKWFNLLTINELDQDHFKTIREWWETALKNKIDSSNEQNENDWNWGFEKVNNINAGLNIGNINWYIVNKIWEGKDILRKTADAEWYECNMNNVKEFLWKISNSEIKFDKEFIRVWSDSRKAWLSAVQLLLNNQYSNRLQVDGQYRYKGETWNAVQEFQKKYNGEHSNDSWFEKLEEDWIPGPLTLAKLLDTKKTTQTNTPDSPSPTTENLDGTTPAINSTQENIIDEVLVTGSFLKPKEPIFGLENEWGEDGKIWKLEWIWAFDGNGNFKFDENIKEVPGWDKMIINVGNDVFTKIDYTNWNWMSIQEFSWKWYQVGNSGEMKWFFIWEYDKENKSWKWKRVFENGAIYDWEWSNGLENWKWKYIYPNWDAYEWNFENGKFNWEWSYTWKNWTKYGWEFKDDLMTTWMLTLKSNDWSIISFNVENDGKWLKIISDNVDWTKGKYIDVKNWSIIDAPVNWGESQNIPTEQPVTPVEQPITVKPREQMDLDPEKVTQYGLHWNRLSSDPRKKAYLGIPKMKNVYTHWTAQRPFIYKVDDNTFYGVNEGSPYEKTKIIFEKDSSWNTIFRTNGKELNVCQAWVDKLNAYLNSNHNVWLSSIRIEGGTYIWIPPISGPWYGSSVRRIELKSDEINKIIKNENVFARTASTNRNTPTNTPVNRDYLNANSPMSDRMNAGQ